MQVIVIGGGIIGTLSAYYLHQSGFKVTVLEQQDEVASMTSAHNGAQLSYAYVSPLGSPAVYTMLKNMLLGKAEDIKVTRGLDPQLLNWGIRLLANSSQKSFDKNQQTLLSLTLESKALMESFLARHKTDFKYDTIGKIHIYPTQQGMETAQKFSKILNSRGIAQQFLSPEELWDLEPALKDRRGSIVGGMLSPSDSSGDTHQFAITVKKLLQDKVTFKTNTTVKRIHIEHNRFKHIETTTGEIIKADTCVVAAGVDAYQLLKAIGIRVPLYPIKGYATDIPNTINLRHNITDHQRRTVFSPSGDKIRVAGFMHFSGKDSSIPPATANHLKNVINTVFPQADANNLNIRTGWRPYTPSSTPIIGKSNIDGVYLNIGQGMLGWTLAHVSGKKLAESISFQG